MDGLLALTPLILLVLIVWLVARRFTAKAGPERPGPNGEEPYGVRGWLAFYVYMSMTLSPLMSVSRLNQSLSDVESKYPALLGVEGWGSYKAVSWVTLAFCLGWQIWVARRLKNKLEPSSLFHVRLFLIACPAVVAITDSSAAWICLNVTVGGEEIGKYIAGFMIGGVWLLYFFLSKRVRNTYRGAHGVAVPPSPASAAITEPVTPSAKPAVVAVEEPAAAAWHPAVESRTAGPNRDKTIEQRLHELRQLLDRGLITEQDFEAKKQEILHSL